MNAIPTLPIFCDMGILLEILEWNDNTWYVRYCTWNYDGDPENSKKFYLHPKSNEFSRWDIQKSNTKTNKNNYYVETRGIRWYLPKRFKEYIKANFPTPPIKESEATKL